MSGYISTEYLKEHIKACWINGRPLYAPELPELLSWIDEVPTVDAVEVVRCKDCKHSEHWYGDKRRCFLWSEDGIDVFNDGYCNYAERSGE